MPFGKKVICVASHASLPVQ